MNSTKYQMKGEDTFRQVCDGLHGDTVHSDNPKLDAYKQAAYLQMIRRGYQMVCNADGSYTVKGDGCMAITFDSGYPSETGGAVIEFAALLVIVTIAALAVANLIQAAQQAVLTAI